MNAEKEWGERHAGMAGLVLLTPIIVIAVIIAAVLLP
jgi:hypothetical protein